MPAIDRHLSDCRYGAECIALIDTDGDGLISFSEFVFFRAMLRIRPTDLELAFQMFDRDESGSIDRDEFSYLLRGIYA